MGLPKQAPAPLMGKQEAEALIGEIRRSFDTIQRCIYELDQGRGWEALKYQSLAKCLLAEFPPKKSQIYRHLKAYNTALAVSPSGGIGIVAERVLRPLTRFKDDEVKAMLWSIAETVAGEDNVPTSTITEGVVNAFVDAFRTGTLTDEEGDQTPIATLPPKAQEKAIYKVAREALGKDTATRLLNDIQARTIALHKEQKEVLRTQIASSRDDGKKYHYLLNKVSGQLLMVLPGDKRIVLQVDDLKDLSPGQSVLVTLLAPDEE